MFNKAKDSTERFTGDTAIVTSCLKKIIIAYFINLTRKANLAQVVEQHPRNVQVVGSSPIVGSNCKVDSPQALQHQLPYNFLFRCTACLFLQVRGALAL